MENEDRRHPITDDDIDRIAEAVAVKTKAAFHIEEEVHYNAHKRLDRLLEACDDATNIFWKAFLGLVVIGAIVLAGVVSVKGIK